MSEKSNSHDELSSGLKVVSFCFPLGGALIYLFNMKSSPNKAKTACYAALLGIGFGLLIRIMTAL
jgi:hypothetical protein